MYKMLIMFYCKHCKRRYKSRSSLRNHISLYHKKKFDRKYKCKTCNKSFTSPTKYLKHRKSEHHYYIEQEFEHISFFAIIQFFNLYST